MREISDQIATTEPTGSRSAALSTAAGPVQKALSLDMGCEVQDSREGPERHQRSEGSGEKIVAEAEDLTYKLSPARGSKPSLRASLILDLRLYLSSPSQNLNLRTFPIWLCGAENDLRTWPPGGRSSEHLRSRKGACRTPAGLLFGPIGRLFRPSGHGLFGGGAGRRWSVCGTGARVQRQTGNGWPAIDNVTVRIQLRASQIRKCAFVDICAERGYPEAMEQPHTALRPSLHLCLRPSLHLSLHRSIEPQPRNRRAQRGLRAWRFADISTQPPHRNIKSNRGTLIVLSISPLAFALGAFAIASAPAPQRFAGSTAPIALGATAIASALARHRLIASAPASQRSGVERPRAWRLA
jgi:hypothetical protein